MPTDRVVPLRVTAARLATDWLGWALVGQVSHPQDDFSGFHEVISRPFLTSSAWSQLAIAMASSLRAPPHLRRRLPSEHPDEVIAAHR
jgi:hypothetical protein